MKIQCKKCSTVYNVDDTKIPDHDVHVKCKKCQDVITVPGKSSNEEMSSNPVTCPKCGHKQKQSEECEKCGIILSRYAEVKNKNNIDKQSKKSIEKVDNPEKSSTLSSSWKFAVWLIPAIGILLLFIAFYGDKKTAGLAKATGVTPAGAAGGLASFIPLIIILIIGYFFYKKVKKSHMPTLAAKAYNPTNGAVEEIWEGFSWPCLFLGFIWYIYKGMWGWGVIALILAIFTMGLSWFVFPFFANEQYAKTLLKQGYLNEEQWNEKKKAEKQVNNTVSRTQTATSVSDELSKLAALKDQGVLTDEEFAMQKKKLLS